MYTPTAGDRIIVTRTPGQRSRAGSLTGLVLDVLTLGDYEGVIHFRDDRGGTCYLGTNEQLAEIGVTQTIEREPVPETNS